ncbi:MAG: hypothetical protein K2Q10_05285, partial [Rhodospirillales bacterium]|nr:hypothetical protein [Rhodospirillales bacterium]
MDHLDEMADPRLHQWRCLCRHLTLSEPREAAGEMQARLGLWQQFRPGWNRCALDPLVEPCEVYVHISPGKRLTSEARPRIPAGEIHEVGEPPAFEDSVAWRLTSRLGLDLAVEHPRLGNRIDAILEWLRRRGGGKPLHLDREALVEAVSRGAAGMVAAFADALRGQGDIRAVEKPIEELVTACVEHRLAGLEARHALSELLFLHARLPTVWPPFYHIQSVLGVLDRLFSVACRLKESRRDYDVPS